jgi:hypothetical protein
MKARLATIGILVIVVFSLMLALTVPAQAITGVTDTPTNSTAGVATTHTIAFTTLVALEVAVPEQIFITFPSGFNASGAGVGTATTTPSLSDPTVVTRTATLVTLNVTADETAGAFSIVLTGIVNHQTAGPYTVSVATTEEAAANSSSFNITPGTAASFRVVTQNGGNETAGVAFSVSLTALDAYGNTATTYTGNHAIVFDSTATAAPDGTAPIWPPNEIVPFVTGQGTTSIGFTLFDAGETPTITATDPTPPAISGTSSAITIAPGPVNDYTVTSASYTQAVGVPFTVTVTARDQYENVATNAGPILVGMTSSSGTMVFDGNGDGTFNDPSKTLSNGTFNIPAKDTIAGTGVTITATDAGAKTGTSSGYNITADITRPTLQSITWTDVDTSGTINQSDTLRFNFSEAMLTTTLDSVAEINSGLNSTATGTADYGTTFTFSWNTPTNTQLTVTLGTGEAIAGGETVNPTDDVTDVAGNLDNTIAPGPAIPSPDITPPTLVSITWTDVDTSGTINASDTLRFNFSEAMLTTTLDSVAEINSGLNSTATGTADYGTTFTFVWNTPTNTQLTVTLGTGETIAGGETVNPAATVTDVAGNPDGTTAPGPAIPTPETTPPTLVSITWTDVDDSDTINADDTLRFNFSEAMDTTTITATNIETTLPTSPDHSYGTLVTADLSWNAAKTQLTVTLGSGETIVGGETVNPSATVKDVAGNADDTTAPGPAIPGGTPTPTPTRTPTPTPTRTPTPSPTPTPTGTVGTAESWVEGLDGRLIIHFPAGSFAADTTVTIQLLATCPIAPEGYILGATCFSITAGAPLLEPIDICVRYSSADVAAAGGDPHKLRLAVYDGAVGHVLSTDVDERAQTACASVDQLSDFAIVVGPAPGGGWWSVWWHVFLVVLGVAAVVAIAVLLWRRYRYY